MTLDRRYQDRLTAVMLVSEWQPRNGSVLEETIWTLTHHHEPVTKRLVATVASALAVSPRELIRHLRLGLADHLAEATARSVREAGEWHTWFATARARFIALPSMRGEPKGEMLRLCHDMRELFYKSYQDGQTPYEGARTFEAHALDSGLGARCAATDYPVIEEDEDMGAIFDKAKKNAAESPYAKHPIGEFPGTIEDITQREHEGRPLYEFKVRTSEGTAKFTMWHTLEEDVDRIAAAHGGDVAKAQESVEKTLTRYVRLYTDLGLTAPSSDAEIYERLGEFIGRHCHTVVQQDQRKEGQVMVFLNAPRTGGGKPVAAKPVAGAKPVAPRAGAPAVAKPIAAAGKAVAKPAVASSDEDALANIPF